MADKKKELTERQRNLINYLMGEAGGDIRTAMTMAGYSERTTIAEAIRPIREEVVDAAQMTIAINSPQAAMKMIGVLSNPDALGNKNLIAAAKEVLDRAGVVKTEKVELDGPSGSMFILPPKRTED